LRTRLQHSWLCAVILAALAVPARAEFGIAVTPVYAERKVDVAYNPTRGELLVVWQQLNRSTSVSSLMGALLDRSGAFLRPPFTIVTGAVGFGIADPAVTFKTGPDRYLIVARAAFPSIGEGISIYVLDATGTMLATRSLTGVTGEVRAPAIASSSEATSCCAMAVWEESFGSIVGQRVDADGAPYGSRVTLFSGLTTTLPHGFNARLLYEAPRKRFQVVYERVNSRSAGGTLVVTRAVSRAAGDPTAEITVGTLAAALPAGSRPTGTPHLAFLAASPVPFGLPGRFLVAWRNGTNLTTRFLDDTGAPFGASTVLRTGALDVPAVEAATNADAFVVTYEGPDPTPGLTSMQATIVGRSGAVRPPLFLTAGRTLHSRDSALAYVPVARQALAVWRQDEGYPNDDDVYAGFVVVP
jgi:hypothetical protein